MNAHVQPVCRHFGTCGGCTWQDMPPREYAAFKRGLVVDALTQHGLADATVAELAETGPATRRRAVFKATKEGGVVRLGFYAARSHTIVDMEECHVLTAALVRLVTGLRGMLAELLHERESAELHVTEAVNGFDLSWHGKRKPDALFAAVVARWAQKLGLARITAAGEAVIVLREPYVTFSAAQVHLPPEVFLQASHEGESILQTLVLAGIGRSKHVIDLFAGVGTFALPLAGVARVHAVDSDSAALDALLAAARATQKLKPVTVEKRDLFKLPVADAELRRFDAAVLDPPRTGASAQAKSLAKSSLSRIVYVSCNPQSFARDARSLTDGGYRMGTVTPIDQFLWSSHIELVAAFSRDRT